MANMTLELHLTGGKLRIGKKEMALELLRKDSALRPLLGYGADGLASLASRPANAQDGGDFVVLDFTGMAARRLDGDTEAMLNVLKQRYGSAVSGKLFFRCTYTTFGQVFYLEADLGADKITLHSTP